MNQMLWELQEVDNRLAQLKRERGKLDEGTHTRGEHDTLQRAFDKERTRLTTLNGDRTDCELQLKSNEEKFARQQSRLMNAKSSHEISALERDIKAIGAQRGDFDETILNLMDEIETCSARLKELELQRTAKAVELKDIGVAFAHDSAQFELKMDAQLKKRATIAAQLSPDELEKYNDVAQKHGGVAVAHALNGNCSACGMALTPFNLREAKTQTWPTCENCGRLLSLE